MRIGFLGSGAVGCWFGGRLAECGYDVTMIARGATYDALGRRGIQINDEAPKVVRVARSVAEAGPLDVVVLAVKVTADTCVARLLEGIGPDTVVAVTQNCVETPYLVADVVGQHRTWPGVIRGYLHHTGPAAVEYHGGPTSHTFGTWDGQHSELATAFAGAINASGNEGIYHPAIFEDVWEKAMFVSSSGALGALVDKPLGHLRADLRNTFEGAMAEIYRVGVAAGAPLREDAVARVMDFADRMPRDVTTSMQRDLKAGMAPSETELDAQVTAISRIGRAHGVATPILDLCAQQVRQRHLG